MCQFQPFYLLDIEIKGSMFTNAVSFIFRYLPHSRDLNKKMFLVQHLQSLEFQSFHNPRKTCNIVTIYNLQQNIIGTSTFFFKFPAVQTSFHSLCQKNQKWSDMMMWQKNNQNIFSKLLPHRDEAVAVKETPVLAMIVWCLSRTRCCYTRKSSVVWSCRQTKQNQKQTKKHQTKHTTKKRETRKGETGETYCANVFL